MPVITPTTFVYELTCTKHAANGDPAEVVYADGNCFHRIQINTIDWAGLPFGFASNVKIYFSDGRPVIEAEVTSPAGYTIEVKSDVAQELEITFVDAAPTGNYFCKKIVQFSANP